MRPIIESISDAEFAAIRNGRTLEKQITSIATGWDITVQARSDSSVHSLKKLLLRQPVITIAIVVKELNVSEPAADASVKKLVNAGILTQSSAGRRNRQWQATEILSALDAFGAHATVISLVFRAG